MFELMVKVKDRVEFVLANYPATRDCDATLLCFYLAVFHNLQNEIGNDNCHKLLSIMKHAPVPESIRRTRQKLQEEGCYIGTRRPDRMEREEGVRQNIHSL